MCPVLSLVSVLFEFLPLHQLDFPGFPDRGTCVEQNPIGRVRGRLLTLPGYE